MAITSLIKICNVFQHILIVIQIFLSFEHVKKCESWSMVWTFIRKVSSWKLSKFFLITCKRKKRTRAYGPLSTSVIVYKERHIAPALFDFICESHEHSSSQPHEATDFIHVSDDAHEVSFWVSLFSNSPPPPLFSAIVTQSITGAIVFWPCSYIFTTSARFFEEKNKTRKEKKRMGRGGGILFFNGNDLNYLNQPLTREMVTNIRASLATWRLRTV